MRKLRVAAVVVCVALVLVAIGTIVADREEEPFGPREGWAPAFSIDYQCLDARDELTSSELEYDLRYDGEDRWTASVTLDVVRDGLRGGCEVGFGVPRGSVDVRDGPSGDRRAVTLRRHGSSASGTATVKVWPVRGSRPATDALSLHVLLPRHFEMSHALGLGLYFFEFDFFGPGEAGSFRTGTVSMHLPEGHSFLESAPAPVRAEPRSRTWPLRAGRDLEVVTTYRHDALRAAAEIAPGVLVAGLAALLALAAIPSRRRAPSAEEPEPDEAPELSGPPEPPVAEPHEALVPPAPETPKEAPVVVAPAPEPSRSRTRKRYAWLALLAIPVLARVLRRRGGRR